MELCETKKQYIDMAGVTLGGRAPDIGGGEGVISLCFGEAAAVGKYKDEPEEVCRVPHPDGRLWIWDAEIPQDIQAPVFIAQLEVKINETLTKTPGCGVGWKRTQSLESIRGDSQKTDQSFFFRLRKTTEAQNGLA